MPNGREIPVGKQSGEVCASKGVVVSCGTAADTITQTRRVLISSLQPQRGRLTLGSTCYMMCREILNLTGPGQTSDPVKEKTMKELNVNRAPPRTTSMTSHSVSDEKL